MTVLSLPPAVSGSRRSTSVDGRQVSYYADEGAGAAEATPLLLVHSVNAAGSVYEMRPLWEHYCGRRPVYALDLPGFGLSERRDASYTPRLMTDAVLAVLREMQARHGRPADLLALSLGCEFAARAAVERPALLRTLGLISPTGFSRRTPSSSPKVLSFVRFPLWDRGLFRLLTSPASIRFFLRKTWGSADIDEGLVQYDIATTRQPGARFAPYHFVSGFLFSPQILEIYRSLDLPVWFVHGVRGDFVDYSRKTAVEGRPNWQIDVMQTGALPHFEQLDAFCAAYDRFVAASVTA